MKCSILVANYNSEKYILSFIESVYQQEYLNWELIIVDDHSSDNSVMVFDQYTNDTRVKIFKNNENKGVGYTKRRAASLATGDILMFVDPDDALLPSALSTMVKYHKENSNASLVYSTFFNCDKDLNIIGEADWVGNIKKPLTNLHVDRISHLASFKKEFYFKTDGVNSNIKAAVDKDLYYKLEEVGELTFIQEALYLYRKNNQGVSQSLNSIVASEYSLKVIDDAYKRRQKSGYPNISLAEIKLKKAIHFHNVSLIYALHGDYRRSLLALYKALKLDPHYKFSQKIKIASFYYNILGSIVKKK